MPLVRSPNIEDPDAFYEELVAAQQDLEDAAAGRFIAKLALILANQVGDAALLSEAIQLARENTLRTAA
jgi:Protein of unknown function (DUF2783)